MGPSALLTKFVVFFMGMISIGGLYYIYWASTKFGQSWGYGVGGSDVIIGILSIYLVLKASDEFKNSLLEGAKFWVLFFVYPAITVLATIYIYIWWI